MNRSTTELKVALVAAAGVMLMASTPVSAPIMGDWGGPQVRLRLTETGGQLDLSCASASIETPVRLDAAGKFAVIGRYEAFDGGPANADAPPQLAPARLTGSVVGTKMQLLVRVEGQDGIQQFTLEQGRRTKLIRCA